LRFAICPTTEPTAPAAPGDDDRVAGLRLTDLQQPEVGGPSRHPEDAEVGLRVGDRGVDRRDRVGVENGVVAPGPFARDEVARIVSVARALDDLTDDAAAEDVAHVPRLGVRLGVAHPAAYVRVDGEESGSYEQFTGVGIRYLGLLQVETVQVGLASRALGEDPLAVGVRHGRGGPSDPIAFGRQQGTGG